jgi:hypothetical protein
LKLLPTIVRLAVGALLLLGVASSQVRLDMAAPKASWAEWLRGEPVELHGNEAATRLTLVAFYGQLPHLLAGDVEYLQRLSRQWGGLGLRVVVVVGDRELPAIGELVDGSVVLDDHGRTEKAWLRVPPVHHRNLVAVDDMGVVVFAGAPGCGVADLLHRELAGKTDRRHEEEARAWRLQLVEGYDDLAGGPTVALLAPLVERSPRDGLLSGLLYLTYATKANDLAAATRLRRRSIRQMADEPRALAVFADLAMRGDPRRPAVVAELRPALERAAKSAPRDPFVQLALLRAQVATGDGRAAGRQAMRCRKLVVATADGCLDFATLLAHDQTPMIHRDLAESAVRRAAELGADERLVAAARYVVTLRCGEDREAAASQLAGYLKSRDAFHELNNDAWHLLTQLSTMGRYDWFAVGLVELMLKGRATMDYFEFDTAALAMFLVGRTGDAIELQETALKQGGDQEAEYRDRLRRYQAYRAASPR